MISKQTVLILGAGASYPYGFPLGKELIHRVWQIANKENMPALLQIWRVGRELSGFKIEQQDVISFVTSLNESHLYSIDSFLNNKDPKGLAIGKILIVQSMLSYEHKNNLLKRDFESGQMTIGHERINRRWYDYLFNKMQGSWGQFKENKLTIVTFNYDRSIETFLYYAIRSAFPGKTDEDYNAALSAIPVLHLHGKFGNLPWEGGVTHEYGAVDGYIEEAFDKKILKMSEQIRVVHEEVVESIEYRMANEAIKKANAVYFLGFGYHELNLRRIEPGLRNPTSPDRFTIGGSAFGLEPAEAGDVNRLFHNVCGKNLSLGDSNLDVLGFLRARVSWV